MNPHNQSRMTRVLRSVRLVSAIAEHEVLLLRTDPGAYALLFALPVVTLLGTNHLFGDVLAQSGMHGTSGSDQSVPGMVILFGLFIPGYVAYAFFREHRFGTWTRLHASAARPSEVVTGKLLPWLGIAALQEAILIAVGVLFLNLRIQGSVPLLLLVVVPLPVSFLAYGVFVIAMCRTQMQVSAYGEMGGLVLAGLGGAAVPLQTLPHGFTVLAYALPTYWAMRGFQSVVYGGPESSEYALVAFGVLVCWTASNLTVAFWRFGKDVTAISY